MAKVVHKLRPWFTSLRSPGQIEITQEDEWVIGLQRGPPVIIVTDRFIHTHARLFEGLVRQWGYRQTERYPLIRGSIFVRPLPLWLLHRLGITLYRRFWGTIQWLYDHHIVRFACTEGQRVRLIDIRPWPFKDHRDAP